MSNRTRSNLDIYRRTPEDRQALSKAKAAKRKLNAGVSAAALSNHFRLSDIHKVIVGRHGGQCDDLVWMKRYFRAALPHVLHDARSIVAAGGSPVGAMLDWVTEHTPILRIVIGDEWIEAQVDACLAKPPRRRCPRVDRTSRILQIADHEPEAFKLCSLPAMSRPKAVREAEDKTRRAKAEQARRAQNPSYTPRSESKAATMRAAGINPNTAKSQARRARLAASKAEHDTPGETVHPVALDVHPVSCPDLSAVHPVSCPTWALAPCTPFRAPHLEYPRADLRQGVQAVPETTFRPMPTPEEFAATLAALVAAAPAALDAYADLGGWG